MSAGVRRAIVLFAHGARAARWTRPLENLRAEIGRLRPDTPIRLAFLELQDPALAPALAQLALEGCAQIDIAPIFWAVGTHLARDLPALVAQFCAAHPQVSVRVLPALGELPGLAALLAASILAQSDSAQ